MRLRHMLTKEILQFRRNPALLRMALIVPIMQTLVLSFAANLDVTRVPVSVWDEDQTQDSRELLARVTSSTYFVLVAHRLDGEALVADLDAGRAALAVHIPRHFGRDLQRRGTVLQLLVDGADSNSATVAAGYLAGVAAAYDVRVCSELATRRGLRMKLPQVVVQSRVLYNPDLRSLWFMAPAVLALVLTVLMQGLTSLSIAREREIGTLEQLVMTPIRPLELMLGKLIPYGAVGTVSAMIVTFFVVVVLGVPMRGHPLVYMAATLLFLFATLGLGLVISTLSANQQQAQLYNFFLSFPSMLLSGFIFPVDNLPGWLKPLSWLVPMTHYLEVSRGVYLRGSGVAALWPRLLALVLLSSAFFVFGALRFRKRLD